MVNADFTVKIGGEFLSSLDSFCKALCMAGVQLRSSFRCCYLFMFVVVLV